MQTCRHARRRAVRHAVYHHHHTGRPFSKSIHVFAILIYFFRFIFRLSGQKGKHCLVSAVATEKLEALLRVVVWQHDVFLTDNCGGQVGQNEQASEIVSVHSHLDQCWCRLVSTLVLSACCNYVIHRTQHHRKQHHQT